jgi:hypothetical protein
MRRAGEFLRIPLISSLCFSSTRVNFLIQRKQISKLPSFLVRFIDYELYSNRLKLHFLRIIG